MLRTSLRGFLGALLTALILPACGGGGGSGGGPPPPPAVPLPPPTLPIYAMIPGGRLAQFTPPTLSPTPLTGPGWPTVSMQGLDYDPQDDVLYAPDGKGNLLRIDPSTGASTVLGPTGFGTLSGLAFDSVSRTLYATTIAGRHLLRVDLTTGDATDIGPTGVSALNGLAFDSVNGVLYGNEDTGQKLYTLDLATGQAAFLMNSPASRGLAYDPTLGLIYGFESTTRQLWKIDPIAKSTTFGGFAEVATEGLAFIPTSNRLLAVVGGVLYEASLSTGALTRLAFVGYGVPLDLAHDPLMDVLYGISDNAVLMTVDKATSAFAVVGPTGLPAFSGSIGGLAFDPGPRILYASTSDTLYSVNISTGAATLIGSIGYSNVLDLAFDPGTGTLYGTLSNGQLITINTATAAGSVVGATGVGGVYGLAFDTGTNTLYACASSSDNLYTINPGTGAATLVGPVGNGLVWGLEFSSTENILYGSAGCLLKLNPATGLSTPVNSLGHTIQTQTWDPVGNKLYGLALGRRLVTIDPLTWTATYIADTSSNIPAMTYDSDAQDLLGVNLSTLYRINPATAVVSAIGPTGIFPSAVAYHRGLHELFAVDLAGSDRLFRLNKATGASTLVGPIGFTDLVGLTYDPSSDTLLSYDAATDQLVQIDPQTGTGYARGRTHQYFGAISVLE